MNRVAIPKSTKAITRSAIFGVNVTDMGVLHRLGTMRIHAGNRNMGEKAIHPRALRAEEVQATDMAASRNDLINIRKSVQHKNSRSYLRLFFATEIFSPLDTADAPGAAIIFVFGADVQEAFVAAVLIAIGVVLGEAPRPDLHLAIIIFNQTGVVI